PHGNNAIRYPCGLSGEGPSLGRHVDPRRSGSGLDRAHGPARLEARHDHPAIVSFVLFAWWLNSLTVTIIVTERQLFVGEAHIDRKFVTAATAYEGEAAQKARGVDLDARALLKIRPWANDSVRIDIDHADDPTRYWLVSTRH